MRVGRALQSMEQFGVSDGRQAHRSNRLRQKRKALIWNTPRSAATKTEVSRINPMPI
jgi:hypothetical protein